MQFTKNLIGPSAEIAHLIINYAPPEKVEELMVHLATMDAAREILNYDYVLDALDRLAESGDIDPEDPNACLWTCNKTSIISHEEVEYGIQTEFRAD
jgi:hypothetical protein